MRRSPRFEPGRPKVAGQDIVVRVLNTVLAAMLVLFASVQFNDPDGLLWAGVYGLAARWCGVAAFRPGALARPVLKIALSVTTAAALFGVVWFWPDVPGWWRRAVWWETESAREGMGFMIVAIVLLAPLAATFRPRERGSAAPG